MIKQDLLSNVQRLYYTSQIDEISNLSQEKSRISDSIEQSFNTFKIMLNSDRAIQEYRDKLFPSKEVGMFIDLLTHYDPDNTINQESNKQEIIIKLFGICLYYLKQRYKTTKLFSKQLNDFSRLLEDILELTQSEIKQTEDMKFYETRMHSNLPYLPPRNTWTALCISCLSYTTLGETREDSMKRVRHKKNCSFHKQRKTDKTIYEQYFKIIPPEKKN